MHSWKPGVTPLFLVLSCAAFGQNSTPTPVVTNPTGNQTIVQPAGTTFSVQGAVGIGQGTNGTTVIDAHDAFAFIGNNNAMNSIAINPYGQVGINTGTTGATNWLSIAGGMNVDANDDATGNNWVTYNTNTGISFGMSSGEGIGSPRVDGSANQNGLDFYTAYQKRISITNWGSVGIGTTTPDAWAGLNIPGNGRNFQVFGNGTGARLILNSNAGAELHMVNSGAGPDQGAHAFGVLGNGIWLIHPNDAYNGSTLHMFWGNNGFVGIGTTAPASALDVSGVITARQGISLPDGSLLTSAGALGTITSGTWNGSPIAASYLPANIVYADSTQTITGQKNFTGNLGVGTATPQATLDVNGYSHFGGSSNPITAVQGAYVGWNAMTGITGETDFIDNPGLGPGGFAFMQTKSDGTNRQTLAYLDPNGNLGIGTTTPATTLKVNGQPFVPNGPVLEVNGYIALSAGNGGSIIFPDGSTQSTAYSGNCSATGGDYAESVDVTGDRSGFEPGDVIMIDPDNPEHFIKASTPYSTLVAGIYSTKPGYVGRRQTSDPKTATGEIPMAMVGVVPTKVSAENGPIKTGDLLVTSATPGYAMKGSDGSMLMGAVVGKALGKLEDGLGVMQVLVTLQ